MEYSTVAVRPQAKDIERVCCGFYNEVDFALSRLECRRCAAAACENQLIIIETGGEQHKGLPFDWIRRAASTLFGSTIRECIDLPLNHTKKWHFLFASCMMWADDGGRSGGKQSTMQSDEMHKYVWKRCLVSVCVLFAVSFFFLRACETRAVHHVHSCCA